MVNQRIEDKVADALEALQSDMSRERSVFDRPRVYEGFDEEERVHMTRLAYGLLQMLLVRPTDWQARERRVRRLVEPLLAFYKQDTS